MHDPDDDVLGGLLKIHADVSREAGRLAVRHAARMQCRVGCAGCCVDEITVFEVEAQRIRARHAALLEDEPPHPPGACAFLDRAGACRIYEDRPYVCRTQGLPLRWLEDTPEGRLVEYRDICPLNAAGTPLEALDAVECWTIGPAESRLAELERRRRGDDGEPRRVALRDLFATRSPR